MTWAFVRSMKRHLSPPKEDEKAFVEEIKARLSPEQAEAIISAAHRPNRALYDLSVAIEKVSLFRSIALARSIHTITNNV